MSLLLTRSARNRVTLATCWSAPAPSSPMPTPVAGLWHPSTHVASKRLQLQQREHLLTALRTRLQERTAGCSFCRCCRW